VIGHMIINFFDHFSDMTKPDRPKKRTIDEDEVIAAQIQLSPHRSPKTFVQVGIVIATEEQLEIIDSTIRTEKRSRLTMSLIKSYNLLNRIHSIPIVLGKKR